MVLPSRRDFQELARAGRSVPVAVRWPLEAASAWEIFWAAQFAAPAVLLESARFHPVTGRYSVLVGEPAAILTAKGSWITLQHGEQVERWEGNPLEVLEQQLAARAAVRLPELPPFVGGAVGYFGYDAYGYFEKMPNRAKDDLQLPDMGFLFCDQTVVIDHELQQIWVIALADPAQEADAAYDAAVLRVDALVARILSAGAVAGPIAARSLKTPPAEAIRSTHTRADFEKMVREAQRFIADGDIYQANLSQRITVPGRANPHQLYERLRAINPSPFAAFADFGGFQVVSASPERFLGVRADGLVETRPIAGTRRRGDSAVETARLRQELILNEKERAEHLMLVDLERNDLGRVCQYGSVEVDTLMALEEYSHVIHIVSNVRGLLRPGTSVTDLFTATFPGGTITGCPKIRSMEIIDALEPVRRQLYTGSLGYISATGEMDFNLLIRTALVTPEAVHVQAGAGIVADSDPAREYEETLHKAQALLETLQIQNAILPAAPLANVAR